MKSLEKSRETVMVLAARIGPRQVARMPAKQRMKVMRSRLHKGQFKGSLGSSEGCGIYIAVSTDYLEMTDDDHGHALDQCIGRSGTHENDGLLATIVGLEAGMLTCMGVSVQRVVKVASCACGWLAPASVRCEDICRQLRRP